MIVISLFAYMYWNSGCSCLLALSFLLHLYFYEWPELISDKFSKLSA